MSEKNSDTFEKVKEIISQVLRDDLDIKYESHLQEDLGAESIDIMSLLIEFEDQFGKEIPDEDIPKLLTVGNIVQYIDANLKD
ncbi:MAG: hypothetical protein A2015_09700 [Spirochaetes bacterium GWF1_31_7]|nr:MAG: hypothetical protein A2Y30_04475 [Spirochaetes bacterium GWE1_32_154]OHD47560.1 MAG: hypothetical protein A2015_09700 [Spirochaetes bacterium GWF1_31_7]OHD52050.1 MAG: hypothetical protein A2Y29_17460 [Spirochaetes bacterium GWE2_31_10]HBD93470.1 acyl carrier protein [Spirochaetia bacterium]HBI36223.1 acyl carrier protein [Spirochaetia bacterium]